MCVAGYISLILFKLMKISAADVQGEVTPINIMNTNNTINYVATVTFLQTQIQMTLSAMWLLGRFLQTQIQMTLSAMWQP